MERWSGFGSGATAQGVNNLALGAASQTEGEGASAVGPGANATADFAGSYGYGAGVAGEAGTAVGPWAQAFAPYSAAFGASATANATEAWYWGHGPWPTQGDAWPWAPTLRAMKKRPQRSATVV
ncbi:hypothetical protein VM57_12635 [Stenotrophomonas maltophilia]|uniref:Trimeric autotransporter adhesin YadA-like head domain-containing protein n=1 Tax=Stenotrophomonas maltophilia TaxID=40324 RepID=A0A0F5ZN96_STEMA|nr:hypothetical protein VM57_12635 [Stenotrophomonas maltophilia]